MSVENNINRPFEYYLLAESSQVGKNIKFSKFPELNVQIINIDKKHHDNMDHLSMILLVNGNVITVCDHDMEKNKVHTVNSNKFKYIFQGVKSAFEGPNESHLVMYLTKTPESAVVLTTVTQMPATYTPERSMFAPQEIPYERSMFAPQQTFMNPQQSFMNPY